MRARLVAQQAFEAVGEPAQIGAGRRAVDDGGRDIGRHVREVCRGPSGE